MSMLNYDCVNLAIKDFANGGEFLKQAGDNYDASFISSNVIYSESHKNFVEPYLIKKISTQRSDTIPPFDKISIGFFGLCDEKDLLLHRNSTETPLKSYNPVAAAKDMLPKLRNKVDLVVLLYSGRYNSLEAVLDNVDGIDIVIMGGEYYRAEQYRSKNIIVASTPSQGKYFGVLTIELDDTKKIISSRKRRVPLDEKIEDDPQLSKLVADFDAAQKNPTSAQR